MEGGVVNDEVLRKEMNQTKGRSLDDQELIYGYHFYVLNLLKVIKRLGHEKLTPWEIDEMNAHKNFINNVNERIKSK